MDLLYFLKTRLRFIEQLYDGAAAPCVETKRQIEAGEQPYVDNRDPEYYDGEPAFLTEWQQADDSVIVIGHWCISTCGGATSDIIDPLAIDAVVILAMLAFGAVTEGHEGGESHEASSVSE